MADVRGLTPETGGYLSPGPAPAYGVIAHANLGHAIQYGARRATATDPFWWYIGRRNWDASFAFLEARSEARALRLAEVLEGRYVITTSQEEPRSVAGQLHAHDGRATGNRPALTRFRLVGESLPGGAGVSEIFRPRSAGGVAYKLFQIVPGARAVIEASPGESVEVSLNLRSNQGRAFDYTVQAVADENGEAVLLLPYSTDRELSPRPLVGPRRWGPIGSSGTKGPSAWGCPNRRSLPGPRCGCPDPERDAGDWLTGPPWGEPGIGRRS